MAKIKLDSQTEKTIKTDNVYRYKNHKKKDRYVNPNIIESDIGKDFVGKN